MTKMLLGIPAPVPLSELLQSTVTTLWLATGSSAKSIMTEMALVAKS